MGIAQNDLTGLEVAVTGGTGFIGRAVICALGKAGAGTTALIRSGPAKPDLQAKRLLMVGDNFTGLAARWPPALRPRCVIHLAARVHVMRDTATDPLAAFRATNVLGTLAVAEAAARAGVRRMVYVSSIKAVGDSGRAVPLLETDVPMPTDPYGISKYEAETALFDFGRREGLEIVVIRPPLVYGPGVTANFLSLLRTVARGMPLPLGRAQAPRSIVGVTNLTSAILACVTNPAAAGEVFHVRDAVDVSVAELVRAMGAALGRQPMLLPVPVTMMRFAGRVTGHLDAIERLFSPLILGNEKITDRLGWSAPCSLKAELAETVTWYRSTLRKNS